MNVRKHLLAISIASTLIACGGGGGDSGESGGDTPSPVTPTSVNVTGKVIDGYIQGAMVYLDLNVNGQWDEGEPKAISDSSGSYSIEVLEELVAQAAKAPLRAYIGEGAIDIDTGENFDESPVQLSSLPLGELDVKSTPKPASITPFTTDLVAEVEELIEQVASGETSADKLVAQVNSVKSELASQYGIDNQDALFGDFLDESSVDKSLIKELSATAVKRVNEQQNDYKRHQQAKEKAEEGQLVKVGSHRESFVEWHTGELLHLLIEWQEITTKNEDGSKLIEKSITKFFCDEKYTLKTNSNDEPLIYETVEVTETIDSTGKFTSLTKYNIDKNGDGERKFFGQAYSVGQSYDNGAYKQYLEYFDEGNPSDDDPSLPDLKRYYDDIDLVAAVKAGDMSQLDMVQSKLEQTELVDSGELIHIYNYSEYKPTDFVSVKESKAYFAENRVKVTTDERTTHKVEKDWGADGIINEVSEKTSFATGASLVKEAKPIWAQRSDDVWEEYADYRYDNGKLIDYWYEWETLTEMVGGVKTETVSGKRYALDLKTNAAALPKVPFHEYSARYQYISDELTIEASNWTHFAVEELDFTVNEQSTGQKVTYWQLDSPKHNLWVGHEFSEWHSRDVSNLADKVVSLVNSGTTLSNINKSNLPGLNDYNRLIFSNSFIYDSDGDARTWYVVSSENALDSNPTWELESFALTQEDTNLVWRAEPGALFALTPDGTDSICLNQYNCYNSVRLPLVSIDTDSGSFLTHFAWWESHPAYFFQTLEEAQAKLAEVTKQ
ncbi:hypothetical protein [Vibrio sp. SCSIO 43136]|uniref:hypothetical protein n=1 Tax=Vibrio sp. SCSIO 43136 TaxID=2819101 RepID=UPI00207644D5|nr:hypothetical protein [Vibrio sp. SCSIO 43136]USD64903.1 hypothetical protein J4N39_12595 [Vibrio sp. SCSIO 43136]